MTSDSRTRDEHGAANGGEQKQMKRRHIFVVNSSPDFLEVIRELLQEEQYNVTTTNFVPDTFDQVAALQPSLLMIDLAVGEQAGWDLLEHLGNEAATQGIPVIVVSTNMQFLDRAEAEPSRFGAQRFLQKPFDLDVLMEMVRDLIGDA